MYQQGCFLQRSPSNNTCSCTIGHPSGLSHHQVCSLQFSSIGEAGEATLQVKFFSQSPPAPSIGYFSRWQSTQVQGIIRRKVSAAPRHLVHVPGNRHLGDQVLCWAFWLSFQPAISSITNTCLAHQIINKLLFVLKCQKIAVFVHFIHYTLIRVKFTQQVICNPKRCMGTSLNFSWK